MTEQINTLPGYNPDTLSQDVEAMRAHAATGLGEIAIEQVVQPKNLEALRFGVRGNDAAVLETGTEADKQHLAVILKEPGQHTRDELLESVAANYSGDAYGDTQWTKKIGAWGDSPEVVTEYGKLMEAHPDWGQLGLDAGFMTHLPEFTEMLASGEITATDYAEARQQLKEKLGDKIVWRGTMLSDDEFARVQSEGLGSPLSGVVQSSEQPQEQFEAAALSARPSDTIEKHFHGEHRATPFLSVSEYPEVAISIGRHFGNKADGKKFYLFKLNVPAIDLVSYTDHAIKTPSKLQDMQSRNPDFSIKVGVNGEQSSHKWDAAVESFVFWKIDASEIVEVTQPDISESSWNGRVTKTATS